MRLGSGTHYLTLLQICSEVDRPGDSVSAHELTGRKFAPTSAPQNQPLAKLRPGQGFPTGLVANLGNNIVGKTGVISLACLCSS